MFRIEALTHATYPMSDFIMSDYLQPSGPTRDPFRTVPPFPEDVTRTGVLSGILDAAGEAIVVVDSGLIIRHYNPAAEKLFGYPAGVVVGKRLSVLDRPMVTEPGSPPPPRVSPPETVFATGRPTPRATFGLTDAERAVQWVVMTAAPLDVRDGKPRHVALIYENITARREAEKRVALHGQVIAQAADAILIIDQRGIVLEVNPAFTHLTGHSPNDIVGGSLRIIEHPERDKAVFRRMMEALVRGAVWSNRITHRRKEGGDVECIGTLSPLTGPDGRVTGFAYMLRDMTRIADMERRMITSQKMEAIGTLAGGIAHDFNNLLHTISGYTELAMRDPDPATRGYLKNVLGACERAESLVRRILAFSRRDDRPRAALDIRSELEKSLDFIRVGLSPDTVLETRFECDGEYVLGDPTEIQQVAINLLTNARQALGPGAGTISLELRRIDIGQSNRGVKSSLTFGPYVEIVVADTGGGIPGEILDRIFEPFFTTKPVNEGTGMGLAIVHSVVASMNGDITVNSAADTGTRFTIHLPVTVAPGADKSKPASKHKPETGTERILIVDDDSETTGMISDMLSALGYAITISNSPEDALAVVRERPDELDLVITDQNMPGTSGVKLAAQIREIRTDLPVLLCTGNADKELIDAAELAGVAHIMHKPVRLSAMSELIRTTLGRRTMRFSKSPFTRRNDGPRSKK